MDTVIWVVLAIGLAACLICGAIAIVVLLLGYLGVIDIDGIRGNMRHRRYMRALRKDLDDFGGDAQ